MFLDISIHPLYKIFDFWVQQVLKLISFMDTIEIFPHISLWDTMVALAIIDIIVYIVKFGIHRYHVFANDLNWLDYKMNVENYEPKHASHYYHAKHKHRRL